MARNIVALSGLNETERALLRVRDFTGQKVAEILKQGTDIYRDLASGAAPVGPTGNLRKSFVSFGAKMSGLRGSILSAGFAVSGKGPAAFALPILKIGKRRFGAPHLHLVLFGTKGRRVAKKKKALRTPFGVFRSVGPMPANDFLRGAYNSARRLAKAHIERKLKQLAESLAMRRAA